MFEDFSFSSPSSTRPPRLAFDGDDRLMIDCDSTLISPLSSQCPSPRSASTQRFPRSLPRSRSLYFRAPQQPPTSVPFSAYDHKRLSIGTLTKKLHEHTIQNPSSLESTSNPTSRPASPTTPQSASSSSRFPFPGYVLTPPDTDHDDEGYADSTSSPLTSLSPSLSPQPQSPFLSPTSAPVDCPFPPFPTIPTDLDRQPDPYTVRSHRQHIARLQCNPSDLEAIRCALLADEETFRFSPLSSEACHPSSLPPQQGPRRRTITLQRTSTRIRSQIGSDPYPSTAGPTSGGGGGLELPRRRKSSSGILPSHRIEKNYHYHHHHGPSSSGRKKSEQGLRRKSLVSAALASLIDRVE